MTDALRTNVTISHCRVVSKIGEGGMGEVYSAQDMKLDRKVTLKILPAELATNQDRMRRFTDEAKAAAALNHPNISHIYEIGEHEGTYYIAMEFIEGVTLREKIHREPTEVSKWQPRKTFDVQISNDLSVLRWTADGRHRVWPNAQWRVQPLGAASRWRTAKAVDELHKRSHLLV